MSRLSRFRVLLSQIEHEYTLLLGDASNTGVAYSSAGTAGTYSSAGTAGSEGIGGSLGIGDDAEVVDATSSSSQTKCLRPFVVCIDNPELDERVKTPSEASKKLTQTPSQQLERCTSPEDCEDLRSDDITVAIVGPENPSENSQASSPKSPTIEKEDSFEYKDSLRYGRPSERTASHSTKHSRPSERTASAGSYGTHSTAVTNVFPLWWNPDGQALKELVDWRSRSELNRRSSLFSVENESEYGVFSPLSFPKLHWDLVGYGLILYVAWAMPFQIVFGSEDVLPSWMHSLDVAIATFFSLDVLLNFNTGFVDQGYVISRRCAIARRYSQGWLIFDLVTCIPFDMLNEGGAFTTRGRLLQILKGLKPIRFARLAVTMTSLQVIVNPYFDIIMQCKRFFHCVALVSVLLWNVHLLSCGLSAMQHIQVQSFPEATLKYFDAFAAVFLAFFTGSRLTTETSNVQLLEMLIATERAFIIVGICVYATFTYTALYADATQSSIDCERALQYLRVRGVSVETEIEMLRVLKDCKRVSALQRDGNFFSNSNVPLRLRHAIKIELWYEKLMMMGVLKMISTWNREFGFSLAMSCQEERLATGAILFNVADSADAAYHILAGEVMIRSPLIDDEPPNFTVGMWVGEDALVNPVFRRGIQAVAACSSAVMSVSSSSFQQVLHDLNLTERFDCWVQQALWHGLCGRCGRIGDHFQDRCPLVCPGPFSIKCDSDSLPVTAYEYHTPSNRELRKYLRLHDAQRFWPYLKEMGVATLSDLQELDAEAFATYLSMQDPPVALSRRELKVLSSKYVDDFEANLRKGSNLVDEEHHFAFLSHYKFEAGTEASLILADLEQLIRQEPMHVANQLFTPIFLDSEDLLNLDDLRQHVKNSMNLVLLLTSGVLSRPWCLVELVTATQNDIPIFLLLVEKRGTTFTFPTEVFYADLLAGKTLGDEAKQLLDSCGIDLVTIEATLRDIFNNIALPYSPHRPVDIRHAELQKLVGNCSCSPAGFAVKGSGNQQRRGSTFTTRSDLASLAGSSVSKRSIQSKLSKTSVRRKDISSRQSHS